MKVKYSIISTLVLALALLVTVNSETMAGYISAVEIQVDGFVCATCVRNIKRSIENEEGVAEVSGDWEKNIVAVIPEQDVGWVNLFEIEQRINATRTYTVTKIDVVAVGNVAKYPVEYYTGGLYAYSGDRYRLQVGDTRKSHFILARNDKLAEMLKSGDKAFTVVGTVSGFFRGRTPVLYVTEYKKLESYPEWLTSE